MLIKSLMTVVSLGGFVSTMLLANPDPCPAIMRKLWMSDAFGPYEQLPAKL